MKNIKKTLSVCCAMVLSTALLFQSSVVYCSAEVNNTSITSTEIPEGYTPIYTIADLAGINSDTSGKYILMNDIDMTEETSPGGSWDTGHGWTPLDTFSGVFDGNGHRIIGMHIYGEVEDNAALFSGLEQKTNTNNYDDYDDYDKLDRDKNNATIKNLGITDCEIDIKISLSTFLGNTYVGGIVGCNNQGIIENCYVSGKIKACPTAYYQTDDYGNRIGGIAGYNMGVITNCYNTADIFATAKDSFLYGYSNGGNHTAGIAAVTRGDSNKIENCYNIGKITHPVAEGVGAITTYDNYHHDISDNYNYYLNTSIEKNLIDDVNSSIGKPLTDTQMKYSSSFTGFDFNDTWMIDELSSYPYPQLKSCPQVKVDKLELKSLPNKLAYSQGDELDLSGAVLSITYENGIVTSTEANNSMVSNVDMNSIGKQTAIIQYLNGICSFDITVNEVEAMDIALSKEECSINRNDKLQLNAIVKPDNAGNKSVKWETDNDVVATVTQNGVVHGINAGTATITATTENGLTASCTVTVKVPASSIKLNIRKLILKKGKKKTLKATVNPLETTDTVKWTSSNSTVASVTQDGVVKAKKKGYATIMAKTTSGKYASVEITVKSK